MIIACPACGTRYAVPDAAIGSEGRTVRCAKCKHSWFQEPAPLEGEERPDLPIAPEREPVGETAAADQPAPAASAPPPPPPPPPVTADEPAETPAPVPDAPPAAGPSVSHWRSPDLSGEQPRSEGDAALAVRALRRGLAQSGDAQEPPAPAFPERPALAEDMPDPPFGGDEGDDTDDGDGGSQFDYRAPFTRRRNTLRMWTLAAMLFAAIAAGTIFAVNTYGLPDWMPISRPTFGISRPGLTLDFPATEQRKEALENGEVIFRVSGTITNTARESLDVPDVLVVFSDRRERNIGDWPIVPAKRRLAPGETMTVTQAITNIPAGAAGAAIGWAPN
jgi:predicted Zn finger-like uncharacterized protein